MFRGAMWWIGCGLILNSCSLAPAAPAASASAPTHGPLAAEVTAHSAMLWGRCATADRLQVRLAGGAAVRSVALDAAHDFAAAITVEGLQPHRDYAYEMWCGAATAAAPTANGSFRTAATASDGVPVKIAWGGDVGGQNVCRDRQRGYPIFEVLAQQRPDVFVALGDMIYGDDPCREQGRYGNAQIAGLADPAVRRDEFWAYWRYNREDAGLRRFLASTASYAVWDDHEVRNDFGVHDSDDTWGQPLFEAGRDAFLDYNPMPEQRMYRSVRWGKHAELFILDTRSYRDTNAAPDTAEHPKTMLGAEQRAWFEAALARSDATWKIIVSSVPLVIPTGSGPGRDGWSGWGTDTGFARELSAVLESLRRKKVRGLIWISTDVHFAAVFRHAPFLDEPSFAFYEIETGPLHAGIFPKTEFDSFLHSQRLFLYPQQLPATPSLQQALDVFNFGMLRLDEKGEATLQIVNARGRVLYELRLDG